MPSEEELREARMQERADGWGIIDGIPEDDLLESDNPTSEQTLLESGQLLVHHRKLNCTGDCCLHGTSSHPTCRMPRQWRYDRAIIEHVCPHGIGHPCAAGMAYAMMMGQHTDGVHGCDGCCVLVDNSPNDVESILNEVDQYTLLQHAGQLEKLSEHLTWVQEDIEQLQDAVRFYRLVSIGSVLIVGIFIGLAVALS